MPAVSTDLSLVGTYLDEVRDALGDNAERFTCPEIEALATLFALTGRTSDAADLLFLHVDGEEEDDDHHGWTEAQCADRVRQLLA